MGKKSKYKHTQETKDKIGKKNSINMKNKLMLTMVTLITMVLLMSTLTALSWEEGFNAYYKLDEASGDLQDSTANSEDLTSINGVTYGETGKINDSVSATSGSASATGVTAITGDFSVNFWAYRTASSSTTASAIFEQGANSDNDGFGVWITSTNDKVGWRINNGGGHFGDADLTLNTWEMVTMVYDGSYVYMYINGVEIDKDAHTTDPNSATTRTLFKRSDYSEYYRGRLDEVGVWSRALSSSEITDLYNDGDGLAYGTNVGSVVEVTLNDPSTASTFSTTTIEFNATLTPSDTNLTNGTLYVWDSSDNSLLGSETQIITGESANKTNWTVTGFSLGNYKWNVFGCSNTSDNEVNCSWADSNYTLTVGATINNITYASNVFETSSQTFTAETSLLAGSEISLAQLVYNGTNYTISGISSSENNYTLTKTIDIPLTPHAYTNTTMDFFFRFTYEGDTVQTTDTYTQNVSYINLGECNATFDVNALNFTIIDEVTGENITAASSGRTFESSFRYWLGSGTQYKNFTYNVINSSTLYNFGFCIYPYNSSTNFTTDMDNKFSAIGYSENNYYLRNASLTNVTQDIFLYLLKTSDYTKFYVTVTQGITFLEDAVVNIAKYFIGEGTYKTVGIKLTDDNGEFPFYADIDDSYQFTITQNGELLGVIEKVASCEETPCTLTLRLSDSVGNILDEYNSYYSQSVLSNISYNPTTKIVTYRFLDTTGLANYFRLEVNQVSMNRTVGGNICDTSVYSSSGSITCNMTGEDGDFLAYGYISRSPELQDQILSFFIHEAFSNLGFMGLFLSFSILVTVVIGSAAISRGDPSTVIISTGTSILLLKIATILPFGWITVATIEAVLLFLLIKMSN